VVAGSGGSVGRFLDSGASNATHLHFVFHFLYFLSKFFFTGGTSHPVAAISTGVSVVVDLA